MRDKEGREVNCYVAVRVTTPGCTEASGEVLKHLGGSIGYMECYSCNEKCVIHNETWKGAHMMSECAGRVLFTYCKDCHDNLHAEREATA